MQQLQPNTTLQGGKYRIVRVLGQGGFGITYVGYNTEFEETVAIKEFFLKGVTERDETTSAVSVSNSDNVLQFEEQREKFKKEARRLRKLKSEHIVKVHDLFEENGTAYYVMDFIDGESMAERLKRTGQPLTEDEANGLLRQILSALKEVHQNEIWHLDLKPGNIMVDRQGNAYLIDFGASKQIRANGSMTTSTALCYTPGFAPSEQVGQMYDRFGPWTDLYALGATFYNLLTNRKPPMSIDIEEDEEDAFDFPRGLSEKTMRLVTWMMQPKRKKRPQSVDEILSQMSTSDEKPEPPQPKPVNEQTVRSELPANGDEETRFAPQMSTVIKRLIDNMVVVEGGTFMMGRKTKWFESSDEEEHQVTLSSYSIGRYEVTQEEWEAVMSSNPSKFKGARFPVENVSWEDCQAFISKLNDMTGKGFRLPTEAEWEFAARGGNASLGFKYSGSNDINAVAWYDDNSGGKTHEVGRMAPNELGLYDMSGNVWEWCQDWYDSYGFSAQANPISPSSGSVCVQRGGGWNGYEYGCRISSRCTNHKTSRFSCFGLRLAL